MAQKDPMQGITALPWEVSPWENVDGRTWAIWTKRAGLVVARAVIPQTSFPSAQGVEEKAAMKANADFIAHACNAYPKLIDLLQDFLGDVPTMDSNMMGECGACAEPCPGEECFNPECHRVQARAFVLEAGRVL